MSRGVQRKKRRLKKQELIFDLQGSIIKITCSAKFSELLILRNQTWFDGTESSFRSNAEQSQPLVAGVCLAACTFLCCGRSVGTTRSG